MNRLVEIFTRKPEPTAEPQPVADVAQPVEAIPTATVEQYPNTMIGVIRRLTEKMAGDLENEGPLAAAKLLDLCREGIENCEKRSGKLREEWEKEISFTSFISIPDSTDFSVGSEGVEVDKESFVVSSRSRKVSYWYYDEKHEQNTGLRIKISKDLARIFWASHLNECKVGEEVQKREETKVIFMNNAIREITAEESDPKREFKLRIKVIDKPKTI